MTSARTTFLTAALALVVIGEAGFLLGSRPARAEAATLLPCENASCSPSGIGCTANVGFNCFPEGNQCFTEPCP